MKYVIQNTESGLHLGTWEGPAKRDALDALSRAAGYKDYDDALRSVPNAVGDELRAISTDDRL